MNYPREVSKHDINTPVRQHDVPAARTPSKETEVSSAVRHLKGQLTILEEDISNLFAILTPVVRQAATEPNGHQCEKTPLYACELGGELFHVAERVARIRNAVVEYSERLEI